MSKTRLAIVFGTRPEAIKMAPIVLRARERHNIEPIVVTTGQHREMTLDALQSFGVKPDYDLNLMVHNQTLGDLTTRVLSSIQKTFAEIKPDTVLVQGDTTTAFAASLSAFYSNIPVGHVEAGLRTFDLHAPFPEEMNRRFVDIVSKWYFVPTEVGKANLLQEDVPPQRIFVTGNTVIDALYHVVEKLDKEKYQPPFLDSLASDVVKKIKGGNFFFVTAHRRESFGKPFEDLCTGLRLVANAYPDYQLVYAVHPNPNVQKVVFDKLAEVANISLIPPQNYESLCYLMSRCRLVLTDSGGLQEEAPALGKGLVILRDTTERPEVVTTGWGKLAGTDPEKILRLTREWMETDTASLPECPFGNGTAAEQTLNAILN